ncbi:MAG: hypothetical protein U9R17_08295 [Thermodesulfobacteriota bacterium]|nr:hypothetical protein [Thermodesulfobacteriota bacterium]
MSTLHLTYVGRAGDGRRIKRDEKQSADYADFRRTKKMSRAPVPSSGATPEEWTSYSTGQAGKAKTQRAEEIENEEEI